jgi:GNAT superfamily N-acetyltransferase
VELIRLKSGRPIMVRQIRPEDGARLQLAYDRLSPESRYRRFLSAKPHLSAGDVRYLVNTDGRNHVALVATSPDDAGWILGVGRYVRLPEDPEAAEFAVAVADHIQGEGLGTALLDRLAELAVANGFGRFHATMLADNEPAHRMVQRLARHQARLRKVGHLDEFEIDLAA